MKTKKAKRCKIGGTRKNYHIKLKKIYPKCSYDISNNHDKYENANITYGEMNYEGMDKLKHYFKKNKKTYNNFIDIGSGRGKLCFYMINEPRIKTVIGVEIVKERHDDAIKIQENLQSKLANRVILLNDNVCNIDLSKFFDRSVFVWWSNLCFEQQNTNIIFQKLKNELPSQSIICCSKPIATEIMNYSDKISVPMSWCNESTVYIYYL
jgi:hypothetical protein